MSQDQEEAVYAESTARAPAEEETQVGPLLVSVPVPFHWCLRLLLGTWREENPSLMVVLKSCLGAEFSGSVPSKLSVC